MNPVNGITITQEMAETMIGHTVDFDLDMEDFEYHSDIQAVMDTINMMDLSGMQHMMVSIEDAQDHFANIIAGMMTDDPGMMVRAMAADSSGMT